MFVSNRQFAKALLCFDLDYQSNSMKEISKKNHKTWWTFIFFPEWAINSIEWPIFLSYELFFCKHLKKLTNFFSKNPAIFRYVFFVERLPLRNVGQCQLEAISSSPRKDDEKKIVRFFHYFLHKSHYGRNTAIYLDITCRNGSIAVWLICQLMSSA